MNIKDTSSRKNVGGISLKKLKGEVKLQLFDAKTGKLEKEVKGENLVTNAIANSFASNYGGKLNYDKLKPIKDVFFGGILCFKEALTADADSFYPPTTHDNPVTAHAGQDGTITEDYTRGYKNTLETHKITNGFQWCWEFNSSQGNGKISALAMCPPDFGDFWIYDDFTAATPSGSNSYDSVGTNNTIAPVICDDVNHVAYAFIVSDSTLTVRVLFSWGLRENIGLFEVPFDDTNAIENNSYQDFTYTISNIGRGKVLFKDGNIHILVPNSGDISRYILKGITIWNTTASYVENDVVVKDGILYRATASTSGAWDDTKWTTASTYAMTNDTISLPAAITLNTSTNRVGNNNANPLTVVPIELTSDGYLVLLGTSKLYFINYTNTADYREVSCSYNVATAGTVALGKWIVFIPYGSDNVCVYSDGYVINELSLASYDSTGSWAWAVFYRPVKQIDSPVRMKLLFSSQGLAKSKAQGEFYKMFLSTIKNLDEAITKTATQNMKITYSITEVEEEEES